MNGIYYLHFEQLEKECITMNKKSPHGAIMIVNSGCNFNSQSDTNVEYEKSI